MKNKRIRNICIVLLLILLFTYLVICVNSIMNKNKIGILSYRFYIMSSDSTEANTNQGDLVIAKSMKVEDIKENDSIIYKRNNNVMIKKVIGVDRENGEVNLHIENDDTISNESIKNVNVIGGFGNVAVFIQSPLGTVNILLIAICIFILVRKIVRNTHVEDSNGTETENDNGKVNNEN